MHLLNFDKQKIITLYILNLYNSICQLYLNKDRKCGISQDFPNLFDSKPLVNMYSN